MFDELSPLREWSVLSDLLAHYARLSAPDRQAWHDRKGQDEGCPPRQMARLHGELIANGWLEQNTGVLSASRLNEAPGCYRITRAGLKALERLADGSDEE
jgi:hypothetical protein